MTGKSIEASTRRRKRPSRMLACWPASLGIVPSARPPASARWQDAQDTKTRWPAERIGSLGMAAIAHGSRRFAESALRSSDAVQAESTRSTDSRLALRRSDGTNSLRRSGHDRSVPARDPTAEPPVRPCAPETSSPFGTFAKSTSLTWTSIEADSACSVKSSTRCSPKPSPDLRPILECDTSLSRIDVRTSWERNTR